MGDRETLHAAPSLSHLLLIVLVDEKTLEDPWGQGEDLFLHFAVKFRCCLLYYTLLHVGFPRALQDTICILSVSASSPEAMMPHCA